MATAWWLPTLLCALLPLALSCAKAPPPPPATEDVPVVQPTVTRTETAPPRPAQAPEEREPNDTRDQAIALPLDVPVQGFIQPSADPASGDQDWYLVTVPGEATSVLTVELQGPDDLDVVLEWMHTTPPADDKARIQADVIQKRPGDEHLPNLRVEPGPIYLRVRAAWYRNKARPGSEKPYTITASLLPWAPTLETEPNGTPELAVQATLDRSTRGSLGHMHDRDTWRIAAPAPPGTRLQLAISGLVDVRMEANVHWEGQDGPPLTARSAAGEGIIIRNLAVPSVVQPATVSATKVAEDTPEQSDEAVLRLTLRALAGAAPRAAYDLILRREEPIEGRCEAEPNDNQARANPFVMGEPLFGHLDRTGDKDIFALSVTRPTPVHVTLSPPLKTDISLEILAPDGTSVSKRKAAPEGVAEIIRGLGLYPGTWHIIVRGKPADNRQPYELEITPFEAEGTEREPNGDQAATDLVSLRPGQRVSGWIHPEGDVDWWLLQRPESLGGGIVTLQIDPPRGASLDVTLVDESGTEVTGRRGVTAAQPGTFTHYLMPGRYGVRVAPSEANGAATDAYVLRLLD